MTTCEIETMLELRDITKSFPQQRVLEGISLTVGDGESVAIMGPSGSGKSTLLHCMSGVLVPDQGEVLFDGADALTVDDFAFKDHGLLHA